MYRLHVPVVGYLDWQQSPWRNLGGINEVEIGKYQTQRVQFLLTNYDTLPVSIEHN